MKKLLVLMLSIALIVSFAGLSMAQEKKAAEPAKKDEPAKPAEEKKAEPAKKEKAEVHQITGDVTAVDAKAKTITIKGKDKDVTLDAAGIKNLDKIKVGDKVVAKYSEAEGKMTAKSVTTAKAEKKAEPKKAEPAKPAEPEKPAAPAKKAPGY